MSISMRFMAAKIQRIGNFLTSPPQKNWPLEYEELLEIANRTKTEDRHRLKSRV